MKVAFLVEGDSDKAFIEAFARRILGDAASIRVVRVGGKAALGSTYVDAADLVERGYERIYVLVDADTDVDNEVRQQREQLEDMYRRYGLAGVTKVCMVVPMLEAWLLASYRDHPEASNDPKRDLIRSVGDPATVDIARLAMEMPIDVVRKRAPSFAAFLKDLESLVPVSAKRASERGVAYRSRTTSSRR